MKWVVGVLVSLVAVFALAIGAAFFFTADMVRVADDFFTEIRDGSIEAARSYLSDDFSAGTPDALLISFMEDNRLVDFKEASWHSRSINGSRGDLEGSVSTASGGVVPVALSFVRGQAGWKIYSIRKPEAGLQTESHGEEMPSGDEQMRLVSNTMHAFAVAVNEGSMASFRSTTANLWQQQFSVDDFDEAFAAFYDVEANLTVLDDLSPKFDSPARIDENGVLVISGHYPTQPSTVAFEQEYVFEGLGWKLIGFTLNVE